MRKWTTFSTLSSTLLVVLVALTFASPVHAAVPYATINATDVVRGSTNAVDLDIMMDDLPNISGATVTLTGITSTPTMGSWDHTLVTYQNFYTTCIGSGFSISTGIDSVLGSCINMTGSTINWDGRSTTRNVGGKIAFRFPAGTLTFNGSGTYSIAIAYNGSTVQTFSLTQRTTSTVTFDSNLGTGTMSSQSAASSQALTTNSFTRSGFRFTGWSTSSGTSSIAYVNNASYPFNPASANQILYAQWVALPPQTPALTVSSTTGVFGSSLTLETSGGAGDGAVTYSVANGTASGCSITNGSLNATSAGTCKVTATKAADSTYGAAVSSATSVTFGKIARTLSFGATTSYTLAYGAAQTVTATPSAGLGDGAVSYSASGTACSVNSNSGLIAVSGSTGSCVVSASVAEGTNHLSAVTTTQVSVNGIVKTLTITGGSPSVDFGTSYTPTAIASPGTLVGVQEVDNASTAFTFEGKSGTTYGPSTVKPVNVGHYSVLPSLLSITGGSATNYDITYLPGTLTISRINRTVSFGGTTTYTPAYGDTQTVTATPSAGNGTVSYSAGTSTACSVNSSSGVVSVSAASGTCEISASIAAGTNHLAASTTTSVSITPSTKAITITASSPSFIVGHTLNQTKSITSGALVDTDDISGVTYTYSGTGATTFASSTTPPTAIGTYLVTPSIAVFSIGAPSNYVITYATGTLTILSKLSRTLSFATTNHTLQYGDTELVEATPSIGTTDGIVTYSVGSSTACTVDSTGLVSVTAPSGTCTVTATIAEGTDHLSASTTAQVTATVGARPISITATDLTVTAGDAITPTHTMSSGTMAGSDLVSDVTYTYSGTGTTTYAASTTVPTTAGTYAVTPSAAQFSTGSASNYDITYVAGTITIGSPPLIPTPPVTPTETVTTDAPSTSTTAAPSTLTPPTSTPTAETTLTKPVAKLVNFSVPSPSKATLVDTGAATLPFVHIAALLLVLGAALMGTRLIRRRQTL